METPVTATEVGILGGLLSVVGILARAYFKNGRSNSGLASELAALRVKVNTLWEVYVLDAMREARRAGYTESRSPATPSKKWQDLVPEDVRERIEARAASLLGSKDSSAACQELWVSEKDSLLPLAADQDVPLSVVLGVLRQICQAPRETEG